VLELTETSAVLLAKKKRATRLGRDAAATRASSHSSQMRQWSILQCKGIGGRKRAAKTVLAAANVARLQIANRSHSVRPQKCNTS
jgi:hypothetical protein